MNAEESTALARVLGALVASVYDAGDGEGTRKGAGFVECFNDVDHALTSSVNPNTHVQIITSNVGFGLPADTRFAYLRFNGVHGQGHNLAALHTAMRAFAPKLTCLTQTH